jgi:hypothetical protein
MAFRAGGIACKLLQACRLAARPPAGLREVVICGELRASMNWVKGKEKRYKT